MLRGLTLYGPLNKHSGETYHASGNCECAECKELYYNHPLDHFELSFDGEPFLHVLCNGDRVKL